MKTTNKNLTYRLASSLMALAAVVALSFTATSCSNDDDDDRPSPQLSYAKVWRVDNTAEVEEWGVYGDLYFDITNGDEIHFGVKPGPLMVSKFGVDASKIYPELVFGVKFVADELVPNTSTVILDPETGNEHEWGRYSLAADKMTITLNAKDGEEPLVIRCSAASEPSFKDAEIAPYGLTDYGAITQTEAVTIKKVWTFKSEKMKGQLLALTDKEAIGFVTYASGEYKEVVRVNIDYLSDLSEPDGKFKYGDDEIVWSKLTKGSVVLNGEEMIAADVYYNNGALYDASYK